MKNTPPSSPKWLWLAGLGLAILLVACGLGLVSVLSAASEAATAALAATAELAATTAAPISSATPVPTAPTASPTLARATAPPSSAPSATRPAASPTPRVTATATRAANPYLVKSVKIYDLDGKLAYQGDMDLKPVFDRIAAGIKDPHRDDGITFQNRERLLPIKTDREYYREYVVRTPNMREVGPQRLILGRDGEAYYTPDHYDSFIRIK